MARTIDVILTEDVLKLGNMGDLVAVKPGYARNYLLPHGLGIAADRAAKRQIEVLREKAAQNDAIRLGRSRETAGKLDGHQVTIGAKVAHDDHLFGSVGIRDIVRALAVDGFQIDQRQVHLHENFKKLGKYEVEIRLHAEVAVEITVAVVDADPTGQKLDEVLASAVTPPDEQA